MRLRLSWERHWPAWAMVIPVVLVLGVLVGHPLLRGFGISFTDLTEANQQAEVCTKTLGGGETCEPNPQQWSWVGLQTYVDVVTGHVGTFWLQFTNTITAWGEVAYASAFIQSEDRFTLAYGLQQFVPQFNPQWHNLTPAAVLITIPAGIVFIVVQRHLVGGLTAGSTKG